MNTDFLLKIDYLYWIAGIILLLASFYTMKDASNPKRWSSGLFWGIYGALFLFSPLMPPAVVGLLIICMAVLAGFNLVKAGQVKALSDAQRQSKALSLNNKLFIPALAIPAITLICALLLNNTQIGGVRLFQPKNETLIGLGIACIISMLLACRLTKESVPQAMQESRRLLEAMGWAVALPQLLAILGILFNEAGVGKAVSFLTTSYLDVNMKLIAVAAYCIGMALFTIADSSTKCNTV